jgi:hypothetical protein
MSPFRSAKQVRRIQRGEKIANLVDEAKLGAFVAQAEHMILKLATGERLMVKGGRDGINFVHKGSGKTQTLHMRVSGRLVRVVRIYGHTHPRVTGPSQKDLDALDVLKQTRSYIFEIGGDRRGTLIRPKRKSSL